MRARLACLSLTLAAGLVLSACAGPASQPEPTATPEPAPIVTPTPSPTPDPTATPAPSYTPVSLDTWLAVMPENAPSFSYASGELDVDEDVSWPERFG